MIVPNPNAGKVVNCERCHKRCRIASTITTDAKMAVEAKSSGVCGECIVTGLLKGLTGTDNNKPDMHRAAWFPQFTADSIRLPHIQEAVRNVVRSSGSSLPADSIDFGEIAANWELPLPRSASGGLFW